MRGTGRASELQDAGAAGGLGTGSLYRGFV